MSVNDKSEKPPLMPCATATLAPPSDRSVAPRHLFGAIGTVADSIARREEDQRERARAEAQRVSGNFYVDRLVGHLRPADRSR